MLVKGGREKRENCSLRYSKIPPLKVAPLVVVWTIWKERNQRAFENVEMSVEL